MTGSAPLPPERRPPTGISLDELRREGLLDRPYRWPKKGDRLLRKTNDWNTGVGFSNDGISRHVHIWHGYMSAGEALVEDCRRNPQERHFLIYPILFVYRHALELAMKWILTMYGGYDANDIAHHDLWQLWKLCREVIGAAGDGVVPRVHPERYAERIRGARLEMLEEAGHGVFIEEPKRVSDLALDFLVHARTGTEAGR